MWEVNFMEILQAVLLWYISCILHATWVLEAAQYGCDNQDNWLQSWKTFCLKENRCCDVDWKEKNRPIEKCSEE